MAHRDIQQHRNPLIRSFLLGVGCFYDWLVGHPRLGPWFRDYLEGNGIPLKGKVYAIATMWISIGISCWLVPLIWARVGMLLSATLVTFYILRQKTLPVGNDTGVR